MKTLYLPGILAMAAVVVASNILVQFLLGDWLTWGAFTYPIAFLVTDVMNRVYGVAAARHEPHLARCSLPPSPRWRNKHAQTHKPRAACTRRAACQGANHKAVGQRRRCR